MDFKKLKQITQLHAVTGDTKQLVDFIIDQLNESGVDYFVSNNNTIVVGNKDNPNILFTAHIDEVGIQITDILPNGRVKFLPVGWIFPNRLNHQTIYVNCNGVRHIGVVLPDAELKSQDITNFGDLYISFGVDTKEQIEDMGIKSGQTGTFTKEFYETDDIVVSSALDNKISLYILLTLIKTDKKFFENNAVAFILDEEMEDHSANGVGHLVKADLAVVLDYCPVHQKLGIQDVMPYQIGLPMVMYRGGNYIIHQKVREYFEKNFDGKYTKGFLASDTVPVLEPSNFENNGHTVAVNLCLPAQGYHGESYLVKKKDINGFNELVNQIAKTKF